MAQKTLNSIKKALEKEGKSLYWLAKESGLSYSLIHGYVSGGKEPGLENLYIIAKALKVDPCDLLNR